MKKQLIVLSALFVGFASQCSFYDRMKAQATSMKNKATGAYQSVKKTAKGIIPASAQQAIRDFAKQNPFIVQTAQQAVQKIAQEEMLPAVLSVMKEPIGSQMSQSAKLGAQKLLSMGISEETINKLKQSAKKGFESVFGEKEIDDSDLVQVEMVDKMYEQQRNAATEEERAVATKKLQDFFDSEQGQAFALRHMEE